MGTDDIPQDDMAELFAAVDMDMSGGIDATELTSLIDRSPMIWDLQSGEDCAEVHGDSHG